jgi:hypothetical protein
LHVFEHLGKQRNYFAKILGRVLDQPLSECDSIRNLLAGNASLRKPTEQFFQNFSSVNISYAIAGRLHFISGAEVLWSSNFTPIALLTSSGLSGVSRKPAIEFATSSIALGLSR